MTVDKKAAMEALNAAKKLPPEPPPEPPNDHVVVTPMVAKDYLVGLRLSSGGYSLVEAVIEDGDHVVSYKVDSAAQPLNFASHLLLQAIRKLVSNIP